jgi:hypothetical protein
MEGQGFSVLLTPDPNQRPYIPLLQQLYPGAVVGHGGGDQRQSIEVSASTLATIDGVTLVDGSGREHPVQSFGQIPPETVLPARLTWRAGVRVPLGGAYQLTSFARSGEPLRLALDGVPMAEQTTVQAAAGLHFVELSANVGAVSERIGLRINGAELNPWQTYRLMDAPWGLVAQVERPISSGLNAYLDSMVSMAFFDPELGGVPIPNALVWSGWLVAPRSGAYRMAFAAEDSMRLLIDGQPMNVVTVPPEGWRGVGLGSQVDLAEGVHRVEVRLEITHGGREQARWNWVPPLNDGSLDTTSPWSVVPPQALRPDTDRVLQVQSAT